MKKIFGTLLVSATVLGFGMQVNAESADGVTVEENGQISSDATITVKEGSNVTEPEDENKPSGGTGQSGSLTIDNVIVFNFNDMNLSGRTQNISLKNDGTESLAKRNIQVTDTRGTGNGWQLQIKQSELTSGANTLKGAYITMNNKKAVVEAGIDNAAAKSDSTIFPTVNTGFAQDASNKGEFQTLISANKGQGMGTFKTYYNNDAEGLATNPDEKADDIQLVVPSGSLAGSYQGTVTWSLSDAPTATK